MALAGLRASSLQESVFVLGARAAPPTPSSPDQPEDRVVSGQGQDLLSCAPACPDRQPLGEHADHVT